MDRVTLPGMRFIRRVLAYCLEEGVSQAISGLWTLVAPYIPATFALLVASMLTAMAWLDALPTGATLGLAFAGTLALAFGAAVVTKRHWRRLVRLGRWGGVEMFLPHDGIGVCARKEMVGTNRDLVIWSDVDCLITGLNFQCFNYSTKPINDIRLDCCSVKTNEVYPCYLDGMLPKDTLGIPGRCEFVVNVRFPRSTPEFEGYTVDDFRNFCGAVMLVAIFDGSEVTKKVGSGRIVPRALKHCQELARPAKDRPRVTKRVDG